jgi:hypothetical protein
LAVKKTFYKVSKSEAVFILQHGSWGESSCIA